MLLLAGLLVAALANASPRALADLTAVMPQLQPSVRAQLQRHAAQWAGWDRERRDRFAARAAAWDALPHAQRNAGREQHVAWQSLPESERARVNAAATRFAALEPAQQQVLHERFAALDGSAQRGWRLGPALGADYAALQPLLAQVPPGQHAPLLRVLRAMTPRQRADVAVLVHRTAPQDREALRRELLSTAAGNRDQWLWQRLDR